MPRQYVDEHRMVNRIRIRYPHNHTRSCSVLLHTTSEAWCGADCFTHHSGHFNRVVVVCEGGRKIDCVRTTKSSAVYRSSGEALRPHVYASIACAPCHACSGRC